MGSYAIESGFLMAGLERQEAGKLVLIIVTHDRLCWLVLTTQSGKWQSRSLFEGKPQRKLLEGLLTTSKKVENEAFIFRESEVDNTTSATGAGSPPQVHSTLDTAAAAWCSEHSQEAELVYNHGLPSLWDVSLIISAKWMGTRCVLWSLT